MTRIGINKATGKPVFRRRNGETPEEATARLRTAMQDDSGAVSRPHQELPPEMTQRLRLLDKEAANGHGEEAARNEFKAFLYAAACAGWTAMVLGKALGKSRASISNHLGRATPEVIDLASKVEVPLAPAPDLLSIRALRPDMPPIPEHELRRLQKLAADCRNGSKRRVVVEELCGLTEDLHQRGYTWQQIDEASGARPGTSASRRKRHQARRT